MGGSKEQTVGYKIYLGMHAVLTHGPVDFVKRLRWDKRDAWIGKSAGGPINVNAPGLYGDVDREGGVVGTVDFEQGLPTQGRNDYLQSVLGAEIPAFRGVTALVMRKIYWGMNPYLKAFSALLQRIHVRQDGIEQWYDARAEVYGFTASDDRFNEDFASGNLDAYTHVDLPGTDGGGSIADFSIVADTYGNAIKVGPGPVSTHTAILTPLQKAAPLQECHFKVKLETTNDGDCGLITFTDADLNPVFGFGPRRDADVDPNRRPAFSFITSPGDPGVPVGPNGGVTVGVWYQVDVSYDAITGSFTLTMTNLTTMAIHGSETVIVPGRPDIAFVGFANDNFVLSEAGTCRFDDIQIITSAVTGDMNPAHIIRECLTDPIWGMGYNEDDIDDVSFTTAADTLYEESFGLSVLWDKQIPIEDFVKEILRHIGGALFISRKQDSSLGKFKLKLIRADYDVETLPVFGPGQIERVENPTMQAAGEFVNSVTVSFWDAISGNDGSVTEQDPALVQMQGVVINTTVNFPAVTNSLLASRLARRELQTLSTPAFGGSVYLPLALARELEIADVFVMVWPEYNIDGLVVRILGMQLGDGKTTHFRLNVSQDIFGMPLEGTVSVPDSGWEDPIGAPVVLSDTLAVEAPYFELVQRVTQRVVDDQLTAAPDSGYVLASAQGAGAAYNAQLWTDAGGGYKQVGIVDFSPVLGLVTPVDYTTTVWDVTDISRVSLIEPGMYGQIDDELVVVVSKVGAVLTVGRGVLDTIPAIHLAGAEIMFYDAYAGIDDTQYVDGESIDVKLLPVSGTGPLDIAVANVDTVVMNSRAIRPYPPGNVKINAVAFPTYITVAANPTVTWAHRDRTQQTGTSLVVHTAGSIGPEVGTTYTLNLYNEAGVLVRTYTGLTGASQVWATEVDDSGAPGDTALGDPYLLSVHFNAHLNGANNGTVFTDSAPAPKTITRAGNTVTSTAQIKFGTASALFDGNGDYLRVAGSSLWCLRAAGSCVEGWVYPTSWGAKTILYLFGNRHFSGGASNNLWAAMVNISGGVGKLTINIWDNATTNFSSGPGSTVIPLNTWSHVCVIRVGDTFYGFLNGNLEATVTAANVLETTTNELTIGTGGGGAVGTRDFQGHMDDIRLTHNQRYPLTGFVPPSSQNPDIGAFRVNQQLTYELFSSRDGYDSWQVYSHTVRRYGYGFWYGQQYGGI